METKVTLERFRELLPLICDRETSSKPENWTPDNPLKDHCAVVTLVANNLYGGEMLRAEMVGQNDSHYWNRLPNGTEKDFTKSQFSDCYPKLANTVTRSRSYVLYDPKTGEPREIMKRYKLLAFRLAKSLSNNNPLFDDPVYKKCFYTALDSPCQKKKFGCVIVRSEEVVYEGCNKTIEALKSLCEPKCVRFSIASRTESMIGACGHAEEWGLWEVIRRGISIRECDLYVAGISPDGFPLISKQADFTCLRCAVQMNNAGIKNIYIPVVDHWGRTFTERALKTARAYATGEKKV